jgi:hypothetical protein
LRLFLPELPGQTLASKVSRKGAVPAMQIWDREKPERSDLAIANNDDI